MILFLLLRSSSILKDIDIIFGITGAFSAFPSIINCIINLKKLGANIYPIMSFYAHDLDSKFVNKMNFIEQVENITGNKIIYTMQNAERICNKIKADIMIISPTSGTTISKLANSISDTPVTLSAKLNLKFKKPLVLSLCTSDGLSSNACNIGSLLNRKHIFIVPFRQVNPITKPYTICSDNNLLIETTKLALKNEQIEPLLL